MNKKLYNKNKYYEQSVLASVPTPAPTPAPAQQQPKPEKTKEPIRKGDKIKFTGAKTYSGIALDISKTEIFTVIELSGDRAVIGKGSQILAAVNTKYCKKV